MTFQPLASRLDSLPLVLCGPILRRVLPSSVTVWVALRKPATVTLSVYDSDGPQPTRVMPPVSAPPATRATTPLGEHLHVTAITARGSSKPLSEGVVYFYDLSFVADGPPRTLLEATATPPLQVERFSYSPLTSLPSFSLPPTDLNKLRLIHGSCRKPNGESEDMLAVLDDLIRSTADNATARPHQLLMTGDQIYADEVADALLPLLTDAADTLLGPTRNEALPGAGPSDAPFKATTLPAGTRRNVIGRAGLTTDDRRCHLMSFGEYMAMYLFAWSDVLWPAELPSLDEVVAPILAGGHGGLSQREAITAAHAVEDDWTDQVAAVTTYRAALGKVRRALANVPSYMICDDHEVTDDWNMTREFCEDVYGKPLGMRIIQNGLVAFSLCQAWGNTPEQFEDDSRLPAGKKLLNLFENGKTYTANSEAMQAIVGVHDAGTLAALPVYAVYQNAGAQFQIHGLNVNDASLRFNFTIEGPGHQVIVTDTRTWRVFPEKGKLTHPDLLDLGGILSQIESQPALGSRLQLVVVSTNMPPIPGIRFADNLLQGVSKAQIYEHDLFDSWRIPSAAFDLMIARLSDRLPLDASHPPVRTGRIVLLSGDVHSSSASRLGYWAKIRFGDPAGIPQPAKVVFAQLIGSAFKNVNDNTIGQHDHGYKYAPYNSSVLLPPLLPEGFLGWAIPFVEDPVSHTAEQPLRKVGSQLVQSISVPSGSFSAGHDSGFQPPSDFTVPVLVDARKPSWSFAELDGALPGVTGLVTKFAIPTLTTATISQPPDYRYRLEQVLPSAIGQHPGNPPLVSNVADWMLSASDLGKRNAALAAYNTAAGAYRTYRQTAAKGREIVGRSNLCEITFSWGQGDNKQVHHTVRWREPKQTDIFWARFSVSLALNDDVHFGPLRHPGEP